MKEPGLEEGLEDCSSFTLLTKDELATAHEFFLFARKPDGRRGVLVEYTEQRYMALKCLKYLLLSPPYPGLFL
eukprot:gene1161-1732_t